MPATSMAMPGVDKEIKSGTVGDISQVPSLIPVKAGDRVKTDRRDAVMLASSTGPVS